MKDSLRHVRELIDETRATSVAAANAGLTVVCWPTAERTDEKVLTEKAEDIIFALLKESTREDGSSTAIGTVERKTH